LKLVAEFLPSTIEVVEGEVTSIVIEHKPTFLQFLQELYAQLNGSDGCIFLSENGRPLKISKNVELITSFIPFNLNEKRLITKINSLLEAEALDAEHYYQTMELLANIEKYVNSLSDFFPFNISCSGINTTSMIKMADISIEEDSATKIERVLNYMLIVNDLLGERLFVFINMSMFFSDEDMQGFIFTCNMHKYKVLLIDGVETTEYNGIRRMIIDCDLCII